MRVEPARRLEHRVHDLLRVRHALGIGIGIGHHGEGAAEDGLVELHGLARTAREVQVRVQPHASGGVVVGRGVRRPCSGSDVCGRRDLSLQAHRSPARRAQRDAHPSGRLALRLRRSRPAPAASGSGRSARRRPASCRSRRAPGPRRAAGTRGRAPPAARCPARSPRRRLAEGAFPGAYQEPSQRRVSQASLLRPRWRRLPRCQRFATRRRAGRGRTA